MAKLSILGEEETMHAAAGSRWDAGLVLLICTTELESRAVRVIVAGPVAAAEVIDHGVSGDGA